MEEEHLGALYSFESFPFRLLISFAATFPASGDSFCMVTAHQKAPRTGSWQTEGLTEGLTIPSDATFFFNPSANSLTLIDTSPFRAGLI